jgi:hypothetical protein
MYIMYKTHCWDMVAHALGCVRILGQVCAHPSADPVSRAP